MGEVARAFASLFGAALLLSGCTTSGIDRAPGLAGAGYVALGSSYASGPLIPPIKLSDPARCARSQSNYATLLAVRFGMVLTDRTCSGATTDNILGPWREIAPQIDGVTPTTRLVTLTIGGNDVSYVGNLFAATCRTDPSVRGNRPCPMPKVPSDDDFRRVETQIRAIVKAIKATAPKARVVLVQYLDPVPKRGGLCAATPISETDAALARATGQRLAAIIARVGRTEGADVIAMDKASRGHSPCDPVPWATGAPRGYAGSEGLQWHPNTAGMQATADAIGDRLVADEAKPLR